MVRLLTIVLLLTACSTPATSIAAADATVDAADLDLAIDAAAVLDAATDAAPGTDAVADAVPETDAQPDGFLDAPDGEMADTSDAIATGCPAGCPSAWVCWDDACAPAFAELCKPCASNHECGAKGVCKADMQPNGFNNGSFCAAPCLSGNDNTGAPQPKCPFGYTCDGNSGLCLPDGGVCACTEAWANESLMTWCGAANAYGTCNGNRACSIETPDTGKFRASENT
jgi:hypothetical protein